MKLFKLVLIFFAVFLITGCNKDENGIKIYKSGEKEITVDSCQVEVEGKYIDNMTEDLVKLINEERVNNGIDELEYDTILEACTDVRVKEAVEVWSHTRPDGSEWYTVAPDYIHGENLARGYDTPQKIFDAWMASQSHKDNLLESRFKSIGISVFKTERGYVVAAGFGY